MSPRALLTGEAQIDRLHARVTIACERITTINHPLTSHDGGSATNDPESRPPGYQQAAGAVRRAINIMERAAKDLEAAYDSAKLREKRPDTAQSIGGVDVSAEEGISVAPTYRVATISRLEGHLTAKWRNQVVK